jgi:uncharacterized protein (UPF0332 family)
MDKEYVTGLWIRAINTLENAKANLGLSPDTAANRAYYAAFFAVSALFASEDKIFTKHSGTRSAVHKELINTGRWPETLGDDYDTLMDLREVADYGVLKHAETEDANDAISSSARILRAVHEEKPEVFSFDK